MDHKEVSSRGGKSRSAKKLKACALSVVKARAALAKKRREEGK